MRNLKKHLKKQIEDKLQQDFEEGLKSYLGKLKNLKNESAHHLKQMRLQGLGIKKFISDSAMKIEIIDQFFTASGDNGKQKKGTTELQLLLTISQMDFRLPESVEEVRLGSAGSRAETEKSSFAKALDPDVDVSSTACQTDSVEKKETRSVQTEENVPPFRVIVEYSEDLETSTFMYPLEWSRVKRVASIEFKIKLRCYDHLNIRPSNILRFMQYDFRLWASYEKISYSEVGKGPYLVITTMCYKRSIEEPSWNCELSHVKLKLVNHDYPAVSQVAYFNIGKPVPFQWRCLEFNEFEHKPEWLDSEECITIEMDIYFSLEGIPVQPKIQFC